MPRALHGCEAARTQASHPYTGRSTVICCWASGRHHQLETGHFHECFLCSELLLWRQPTLQQCLKICHQPTTLPGNRLLPVGSLISAGFYCLCAALVDLILPAPLKTSHLDHKNSVCLHP